MQNQQAAGQGWHKERDRRNDNWVQTVEKASDDDAPAQHREPNDGKHPSGDNGLYTEVDRERNEMDEK